MTSLRATDSSDRWRRWRGRGAWLGWASAALLGLCVALVLLEQVASGFYYLDQRNVGYVIAAFVGDVAWLFMFFGSGLVSGVISLMAMAWLVAYISVRCEEVRNRQWWLRP